jgi:ParB family chromosome partitioning protein
MRMLPLSQVRPNPYQPRKEFRPEELAELEASLRATGLLQPVTVRQAAGGQGYELIAGERRFRAATRLGWTEIPAIVKEIDDRTLLTLALVENLQRADLSALEEAEGYQRLVQEFSLTQQQVAEVVGKERSTVANMLRLLTLPAGVRRMLQEGQLTYGHARALLAVGDERQMVDLAREAVARGMSVREVERRARDAGGTRTQRTDASREPGREHRTAEVRRIEDRLRRHLQTDVSIALAEQDKGEIRISFYSADDFQRVVELLGTGGD